MTEGHKGKARVLVVGGEAAARSELEQRLAGERYEVDTAEDGPAALERAANVPPDVVVADVTGASVDGAELVKRLLAQNPELPVIVVTSHDDVHSAVAAMRAGGEDYLTKPLVPEALYVVIARALERRDLRFESENLRRQLRERGAEGLQGLVGASTAMQKVYRTVKQVAPSRASILIVGEAGSGKRELARAIHALSPRVDKPFVALQCAGASETLLEVELFGCENGSVAGARELAEAPELASPPEPLGADAPRFGCVERAGGGTLFLDDIGEIPMRTQLKLLRVLQEKTFERVGGDEPISADVRLIAANQRDLASEVRDGRFREDLFYRLNVVRIDLPPLRSRGGDVLILADVFLHKFAYACHKRVEAFTDGARTKILTHSWPGNVRALETAIERAVARCTGPFIDEADLPLEVAQEVLGSERVLGTTLAALERHAILTTLEATGGSTTKAAELLGISVRTIQYRLHEYGVPTRSSTRPGDAEHDGSEKVA